MSIVWRSPLLDASDHAVGMRAMARAVDAAGAEPCLQQTPWGMPAVVSEAELAWLARRDTGCAHPDATVQRTVPRMLTPFVEGLRVGWTGMAGAEPDREALLRLRQMDAVWVPTAAQRDALLAAGFDEARVLALPERARTRRCSARPGRTGRCSWPCAGPRPLTAPTCWCGPGPRPSTPATT